MESNLNKIEALYDTVAKAYTEKFYFTFHIGDETIPIREFLGRNVDIDFMLFSTRFILTCLGKIGFKEIDLVEREPYPDVEYETRRAYVFAGKPDK
jgi:hypothetical protein